MQDNLLGTFFWSLYRLISIRVAQACLLLSKRGTMPHSMFPPLIDLSKQMHIQYLAVSYSVAVSCLRLVLSPAHFSILVTQHLKRLGKLGIQKFRIS